MQYETKKVNENGIEFKINLSNPIPVRELYRTIDDALLNFYFNQEFYKTSIMLSTSGVNLNNLPKGLTTICKYILLAEKNHMQVRCGNVTVNYLKRTKDIPKKGVDYAASLTFANETITTYEALILWFNTKQPPLPKSQKINDLDDEETILRRSLERDAFLAFFNNKNWK